MHLENPTLKQTHSLLLTAVNLSNKQFTEWFDKKNKRLN